MVRSLSSWVSSLCSTLSGRPRPWQTRLHTIQSQPKPILQIRTVHSPDSDPTRTLSTTVTAPAPCFYSVGEPIPFAPVMFVAPDCWCIYCTRHRLLKVHVSIKNACLTV